jgi:hypothetical protein
MCVRNKKAMTKPKTKAESIVTSATPRRGRIVVYDSVNKPPPRGSKKKEPAPVRTPIRVYHLTDRTNPGEAPRLEVAEEGLEGSFLIPLDAHRLNMHFEGLLGVFKDIELEYLTPDGQAVVISKAYGEGQYCDANVTSALLHMFLWYTPKEA